MAALTRSFYDRETARLRNLHAVAIRCARLINTGHIHCVHSPTRAVAVLLDLCAHVRADLAALKQIGC